MDIMEAHLPSKYNKDGFSIKFFECRPLSGKREFFPHKHIQLEFSFIKSGSGKYKISHKEYSIMPGDVFFFRSNEMHWITDIYPDENMVLINIHFEPYVLWASNDFPHSDALINIISKTQKISNRLDRDNPHIDEVRNLIINIENEFKNEAVEYPLMIKINLATIFINLIRNFYFKNSDDDSFQMDNSNFSAIEASMDYIQEHLTEPIKLEDLAAVANMSKTYYTTIFKKLNGVTPWDHIVSKRIDLAISYLQNDSQTMLDLALKCGFNSTANFNRAFKKYTGRTPSEYKAHGPILLL